MRVQPGGLRTSGASSRPAVKAVMELVGSRPGLLPRLARPDRLARAIQARRNAAAAGTAADASRRPLLRQS